MKAFLLNEKVVVHIDKKEEITPDTFLITDAEEDLIVQNINCGGHFWVEDGILKLSGPAPHNYSKWDEATNKWVDDEILKKIALNEIKANMWIIIKELRDKSLTSGVEFSIGDKTYKFHTDVISAQSYQTSITYLSTHKTEVVKWKTMSNEFVEMDYDLLCELTAKIFKDSQAIFAKAEVLKAKIDKMDDEVLTIDIEQEWHNILEKK